MRPEAAAGADGGVVVITRFECPGTWRMLLVLALHLRLKLDVRRQASGYQGSRLIMRWRERCVLSISLWDDLDSVYSMGEVPRHVSVTRLPGRLGISTAAGIYSFAGDWRRVMFGGRAPARSPLQPLRP